MRTRADRLVDEVIREGWPNRAAWQRWYRARLEAGAEPSTLARAARILHSRRRTSWGGLGFDHPDEVDDADPRRLLAADGFGPGMMRAIGRGAEIPDVAAPSWWLVVVGNESPTYVGPLKGYDRAEHVRAGIDARLPEGVLTSVAPIVDEAVACDHWAASPVPR